VYEATFDERYIDAAVEFADQMLTHFADPSGGGFYYTPDDGEQLISRHKDLQDSATPSGNSMAATALVRLGKLTGRSDYLDAAVGSMRFAAGLMSRYPTAAGQMLIALDWHLGPTYEIAILGDLSQSETRQATRELFRRFLPNKVVAFRSHRSHVAALSPNRTESLDALFAGKEVHAQPAVYICENFACQSPHVGLGEVLLAWERIAGSC
jgi:uncharacterized protein YyaL (SSP411 family)